MSHYEIREFQKQAKRLKDAFKKTEDKTWTIETLCLELIVQFGHLVYVNWKDVLLQNEPYILVSPSLSDELCDVLFQVLNVANCLDIDIETVLISEKEDMLLYTDSLEEIMIQLNNSIGILFDSILRLQKYKESQHYGDKLLKKELNRQIVILLKAIEKLGYISNIDIYDEYSKMISSSYEYLEQYEE
ncbi:MAG: hypothetical protein EGR90_04740 [Lachnospiraceae bacterium]|nr:hypothetical protein [Lachnospiraceae bacterium]